MTRADFNRELDLSPSSSFLRLLYADWLQDSGDPELEKLAEGYRMLGRMERYMPGGYSSGETWGWLREPPSCSFLGSGCPDYLPFLWHAAIPCVTHDADGNPLGDDFVGSLQPHCGWDCGWNREQAEDAAALGWSKLSESDKLLCIKEWERGIRESNF